MIPLADIFGIPTEALTLLFLIALSFVNWIKNRFLAEQEAREQPQDDPMRDVVWRRQVGEEVEQREFHGSGKGPPPIPAGTIRIDRRQAPGPPGRPPAPAPPLKGQVAVVSKRQAALADAFEHSQSGSRRRRTGHRREVDKLLRSPAAAQNAILLMEILGPPVGLKPHQDPFS